ncbi:MAG: permease-like cell division protein FtsX [Breznakia sp.]
MIDFFRSLPLHLRRAVRSIQRRFGSALSSMFAVAVTLVLMMLFLITAFNVNVMSKTVESSIGVFVRIDEALVEEANYKKLQKEIENVEGVSKVTYSSKEEQFDILIEDAQGGEGYETFRTNNPLPPAFYVEINDGKKIDTITKKIEAMEGIKDASYGGNSTENLINGFNSLRVGGGIFVGVLCALAIFLISNTIKTNIYARHDEIGIMRNVGASNWFVKTPFLIEGILIGIGGSIVPIVVTCVGYQYLYTQMKGRFFSPLFEMLKPFPFVVWISLLLLGIGMLVGFVGSLVSVNKYLKWKR